MAHEHLDEIARDATKRHFHQRNLLFLEAAISNFLSNDMRPEEVAKVLEDHAKQLRDWG